MRRTRLEHPACHVTWLTRRRERIIVTRFLHTGGNVQCSAPPPAPSVAASSRRRKTWPTLPLASQLTRYACSSAYFSARTRMSGLVLTAVATVSYNATAHQTLLTTAGHLQLLPGPVDPRSGQHRSPGVQGLHADVCGRRWTFRCPDCGGWHHRHSGTARYDRIRADDPLRMW